MAIQIELNQGIDTYPKAYARITNVEIQNAGVNTNVIYRVEVWKTKKHRDVMQRPLVASDHYEVMAVDLVSVDVAGCYEHLKTQEKYLSGIDL